MSLREFSRPRRRTRRQTELSRFKRTLQQRAQFLPEFPFGDIPEFVETLFTQFPNVSILDKILEASRQFGYNEVRVALADFLNESVKEVDQLFLRSVLSKRPLVVSMEELVNGFGLGTVLDAIDEIRILTAARQITPGLTLKQANKLSERAMKVVIRESLVGTRSPTQGLIQELERVFGKDLVTDVLIELGIGRKRRVLFTRSAKS